MKVRVGRWGGDPLPEARDLRRRMEAEGYHVFEWPDPPGRTYAEHSHPEDQSHWVLRGAIALTVEGEEYVLRPGDRDFMPAGTTHSARVVGDEPVVYLVGARR